MSHSRSAVGLRERSPVAPADLKATSRAVAGSTGQFKGPCVILPSSTGRSRRRTIGRALAVFARRGANHVYVILLRPSICAVMCNTAYNTYIRIWQVPSLVVCGCAYYMSVWSVGAKLLGCWVTDIKLVFSGVSSVHLTMQEEAARSPTTRTPSSSSRTACATGRSTVRPSSTATATAIAPTTADALLDRAPSRF